ncbi:ferric reductase like transmembrane component-domain-containing protein [Xylariomycetidae sp. FL0641]|nr:ferric reductase like transmembrane component-domain-containing protein [Xylariomycetidae sp. FL0641]
MEATEAQPLAVRHIQNMSEAQAMEPHWGYVARSIPCTNDPGSCEYLDVVYASHDRGMLYIGIIWATIAGILFLWAIGRRAWPSSSGVAPFHPEGHSAQSSPVRLSRAIASFLRQKLLPETLRPVFGRTTRLQVLILAVLSGYLLLWSFVGIVYKTWITPVEDSPGLHNTRSGIGPWSDRVGILAYGLTPLSVMLSSRESILSLLTGVPYQSFNFLHRWLGYIILVQGALHTVGWCVVELRLYQPQPSTGAAWIAETYIVWGVVAMVLMLLLFGLSTPWAVRRTGYEFFRKAHYLLAMLYIGACWGHWYQLHCFLLPSLLLWFLDRFVRLLRTGLLHYQHRPDGGMGFRAARAALTLFPDPDNGDVVRLDFAQPQDAWRVGQHFYLCFAECSVWQSHPFTPLNLPRTDGGGLVAHAYILRAKSGETKKLAELALKKLSATSEDAQAPTTPVVLTGPYGDAITRSLEPHANVLCVAGGTGITYVLPVLLDLLARPPVPDRKLQLVWAVRRAADMAWVARELEALHAGSRTHGIAVHVYVTREASSREASLRHEKTAGTDDEEVKDLGCCASSSVKSDDGSLAVRKIGGPGFDTHPDLGGVVRGFVGAAVRGPTRVFASGPGGLVGDLRAVVAACNAGARVWRGEERFDVSLTCDDRLEW